MAPAAATEPLSRLFGFAQFDLAGALALADGRYLVRGDDEGGEERESVLVIETLAALPLPGRRRRRPRPSEADAEPPRLPLCRATAVIADRPFEEGAAASAWLGSLLESEEELEDFVVRGVALLNRALHAQALAAADPRQRQIAAQEAIAVRVGYASGEEAAAGHHSSAELVDMRDRGSRRARRAEELRPQERVAAILGGKESFDPCETLMLRIRADLDAGRRREAALQLPAAIEAILAGPPGATGDAEDMAALRGRAAEAKAAAGAALAGEPSAEQLASVSELLATGERVLRRRRVLRGG